MEHYRPQRLGTVPAREQGRFTTRDITSGEVQRTPMVYTAQGATGDVEWFYLFGPSDIRTQATRRSLADAGGRRFRFGSVASALDDFEIDVYVADNATFHHVINLMGYPSPAIDSNPQPDEHLLAVQETYMYFRWSVWVYRALISHVANYDSRIIRDFGVRLDNTSWQFAIDFGTQPEVVADDATWNDLDAKPSSLSGVVSTWIQTLNATPIRSAVQIDDNLTVRGSAYVAQDFFVGDISAKRLTLSPDTLNFVGTGVTATPFESESGASVGDTSFTLNSNIRASLDVGDQFVFADNFSASGYRAANQQEEFDLGLRGGYQPTIVTGEFIFTANAITPTVNNTDETLTLDSTATIAGETLDVIFTSGEQYVVTQGTDIAVFTASFGTDTVVLTRDSGDAITEFDTTAIQVRSFFDREIYVVTTAAIEGEDLAFEHITGAGGLRRNVSVTDSFYILSEENSTEIQGFVSLTGDASIDINSGLDVSSDGTLTLNPGGTIRAESTGLIDVFVEAGVSNSAWTNGETDITLITNPIYVAVGDFVSPDPLNADGTIPSLGGQVVTVDGSAENVDPVVTFSSDEDTHHSHASIPIPNNAGADVNEGDLIVLTSSLGTLPPEEEVYEVTRVATNRVFVDKQIGDVYPSGTSFSVITLNWDLEVTAWDGGPVTAGNSLNVFREGVELGMVNLDSDLSVSRDVMVSGDLFVGGDILGASLGGSTKQQIDDPTDNTDPIALNSVRVLDFDTDQSIALPGPPTPGCWVKILVKQNATGTVTLTRGSGILIMGEDDDLMIEPGENKSFELIYYNDTEGWIIIE